jgi:magnesium transporter
MVEEIKKNNLKWININNPTSQDLEYLEKQYKFHALDLDDCRSKVQRPKFEDYDDYKFLVFHFPVMKQVEYRLTMEEVDIFWGKNYIITLHSTGFTKINEIFNSIKNEKDAKNEYLSKDSDYLLYQIIHDLVITIFPIMNRISREIDIIDNSFDKLKPIKLIERISILRRNIIFLQTSFKPHKNIFSIFEIKLENQEEKGMDIYWGDIGDYISKLMDMAEDYQELLEGLYSSIDTLLTYRTNNIIKTLTIFSVIMLPLSFITGFFGMNLKLPLANLPSAAGVVSFIMLIIALAMLIFFKIRKF